MVEQLCELLRHPYKAVRHLAARCIATLAALDTPVVMTAVVRHVLPQLAAPDCVARRQGAVECLACIADKLQLQMVPYIVLFVVPLLGKFQLPTLSVLELTVLLFSIVVKRLNSHFVHYLYSQFFS